MKKNKISFVKMTACGNNFIIIDARKKIKVKDRITFAKQICDTHFGIGADGVFFIEKPANKKNQFKWDFYNSDGSAAEMCGNGARCVALYCVDNKIAKSKMHFETLAGVIGAKVSKKIIEVEMTTPKIIFKSVIIPNQMQEKIDVTYLNVGVPHVVKENADWSEEYLEDVGSFLRNHEFFKKTNGANATFYEIIGPSEITAATFERGVEGITLACGTGAVAAAVTAVLKGQKAPIKVRMPGGEMLVELNESLTEAHLKGPAEYICSGEYYFE